MVINLYDLISCLEGHVHDPLKPFLYDATEMWDQVSLVATSSRVTYCILCCISKPTN